jgi:hypothetical protein
MAIDTTQLTDYSWSDIAKAAKTAMLTAAVGGSELRMPDGRFIKRMTVAEAKELYQVATEMTNVESSEGGGIALLEFREQV